MTATLLIAFLIATAAAVLGLTARYLPRRTAFGALLGLPIWLLYAGLLGHFGVVRSPNLRPPGIAFIVVPIFLFVSLFLIRSAAGARIALAFPLWLILAAQSFRVGVELFLHQLWREGLAPQMLTFAGANVDIWIGFSAPLVAWFSTQSQRGMRLALAWNFLGLLALANVVVRSALTAPGPLNFVHAEVPNLVVGTFPFVFIPGFFAPLAVILHVLATRALRSRLRAEWPAPTGAPSIEHQQSSYA